jgi:hypothetical protein
MDANAASDNDAEPPVRWADLSPGQQVRVRESGRPAGTGVIDSMTPDGSVVWIWIHGHSPRRMYLAGDPVQIRPELENPHAF